MINLFPFQGGIKLKAYKRGSTDQPVQQAVLPKFLILPLQQHIGEPARAVVAVGDKVFRGQLIAQAADKVSAPVHASSSGRIVAIEPRPTPHPSGLPLPCIVIETDGLDQSRRREQRFNDYRDLSPEQIRDCVHAAGVVGLGGAGFPSFIKLSAHGNPVKTLILNGAECEPYITCDDMLMREQAGPIVTGLLIMQRAVGAENCLIAIENNKPLAIERMRQAVLNSGRHDIEVVSIPTVYPAGSEKQLIQTLTGQEVPHRGIPLDIHLLCLNVGTAYAVNQAVQFSEPLISRYVTINGAVAKARNLEVRIGTPMHELIAQCGGNPKTLSRLIMGGPMMGVAMHSIDTPVIKTTNCILATSVIADVPIASRQTQALPCIRCGDCVDVCPMGLLPQQLYWYAKAREFDRVQDYHLFDCIECGCCDYVCPSQIPLVQFYRFAKSSIWRQEREKKSADIARQRHEFRLERLAREKQEREARHKNKRAEVSPQTDTDKKKQAIQAAMARSRAKREQQGIIPKNTANLNEEQQRLIAEVDRRRAANEKQRLRQQSGSSNHEPAD